MKKLRNIALLNRIVEEKVRPFVKDLNHFIKQCLGKKKILIISDKNIVSLPVSSRFQGGVTLAIMAFMLWVSYSTGKYFAYENIISEKDHEIWSSNVTNENLQYQVTDLHQNLLELNKYFENIQELDQLATKPLNNEKKEQVADEKNSEDPVADADPKIGAENALFKIREKMQQRIASLESVIEMTGLEVADMAANNAPLNAALSHVRPIAQGGPFIPADSSSNLFNKDEFEHNVNYLMQLEKTIHTMPLSVPMKGRYWFSSRFGKRKDPIHGRMAMHGGLDLVGPMHANVYSAAPGKVIRAQRYGAYGKVVIIDHGSGMTTRYGHLHKINVKKGQDVVRGQVLGQQGNTGRSTGDHLHYEVRYNKTPLDPAKFLKAGKYVF